MWFFLACAQPPEAERARAAFALANGGDARAGRACAALDDATTAGLCAITAAEHGAADCAPVADPWRGECYFVASEREMLAGDRSAAIVACQASGPFADDCARHLWRLGQSDGGDRHALLEALHGAFPRAGLPWGKLQRGSGGRPPR